jgi:hypothetical protein
MANQPSPTEADIGQDEPAATRAGTASLKSFGWALLRIWRKIAQAPLAPSERKAVLHARILWLCGQMGYLCKHRQPVVYTTDTGTRVDGRIEYVLKTAGSSAAVEIDIDGPQVKSLLKLLAHPGERLWVVLDDSRTKEQAKHLRHLARQHDRAAVFILHLEHGWV